MTTPTASISAIRTARTAVAAAAEVDPSTLKRSELEDSIVELARLTSQAKALELRLAAEADRRQVADQTADTSTDGWLVRLTGDKREVARGGVLLAQRLQETYTGTLAALGRGDLRLTQVNAIVDGLQPSANEATPEQLQAAEQILIDKATGAGTRSGRPMAPAQLRRAARSAFRTVDEELHRRHQSRSVRQDEDRGDAETWLTLSTGAHGTVKGRFTLPELQGQLLRTVLEQLSAPRRWSRDAAGNSLPEDVYGKYDYAERLGRAFCELIEHFPTDHLPRSIYTLLVTMDYQDLFGRLTDDGLVRADGVGSATNGVAISAGEARRIACEAGIVPAVLGGESAPLDLGRSRRLHTSKQRQALALMHDECAIAGCDRPFAWCEIHHPIPWSAGGATDLDNAIPLCAHHHRAAHREHRYRLVRHSDTEWTLESTRTRSNLATAA